MASACVNKMTMSPENFAAKYKSYGWLSPRMSFSGREFQEDGEHKPEKPPVDELDPDLIDFEFRLEDPVTMLPADELFSDGKLVPLHLSMLRPAVAASTATSDCVSVRLPETPQLRMRNELSNHSDPYLFSPKAPRCTTRWRELLGFRKTHQSNTNLKQEGSRTSSLPSNTTSKSLKNFLHRSSKSMNCSIDSSLNLPLLTKDSDTESVSISSRLSLSSSSSGHDHDDLPRLSLDSDKPSRNAHQINPRRVRIVKSRVGRSPARRQPETTVRGVSVDSPRMNSSGKIVFHSLERSSSSPSTFNGGPRYKHRGMERSYSANVRITPVLNVPVCSLRGSSKSGVFGLFSSSSSTTGNKPHHYTTTNNRSRSDRIIKE